MVPKTIEKRFGPLVRYVKGVIRAGDNYLVRTNDSKFYRVRAKRLALRAAWIIACTVWGIVSTVAVLATVATVAMVFYVTVWSLITLLPFMTGAGAVWPAIIVAAVLWALIIGTLAWESKAKMDHRRYR